MTSKGKVPPSQDNVNKLTAVLDEHREKVLEIPGVTGCGVGLSEMGEPDQIVIKVFVASRSHVEVVRSRLKEIFGQHPVEAVYMPIPDAG